MFPDDLLIAFEREKRAARRKARAKGWQEGRREGEVAALLRLLARRFGELPPEVRARVEGADLAVIGTWFDQAIDAADLDAVFRLH